MEQGQGRCQGASQSSRKEGTAPHIYDFLESRHEGVNCLVRSTIEYFRNDGFLLILMAITWIYSF